MSGDFFWPELKKIYFCSPNLSESVNKKKSYKIRYT